jgi:hypothetical protein
MRILRRYASRARRVGTDAAGCVMGAGTLFPLARVGFAVPMPGRDPAPGAPTCLWPSVCAP